MNYAASRWDYQKAVNDILRISTFAYGAVGLLNLVRLLCISLTM